MNLYLKQGIQIYNGFTVNSATPLDCRLICDTLDDRQYLIDNKLVYESMPVYVRENKTLYRWENAKWEAKLQLSEADNEKLGNIQTYLTSISNYYTTDGTAKYLNLQQNSYNPSTKITDVVSMVIPEAKVNSNGTTQNGLISNFYVNRLNNIGSYVESVGISIPTGGTTPSINVGLVNPDSNTRNTVNLELSLVNHTQDGTMSYIDKIKLDSISTYLKSISLREAAGVEDLGLNYVTANSNTQTTSSSYLNIPLVTDLRNGLVSPDMKHWIDNASGVSSSGTSSRTWQLNKSDIDTPIDTAGGVILKNNSGALEVRNPGDTNYSNLTVQDLVIKGNVTQEGDSFITQAETVEVTDNTILLNKGEVGAGVTKGVAGLEIDRGTEPQYQIHFVESDKRFKAGMAGDLWCLTLRDNDVDMKDGMFTSWDATGGKVVTTNTTSTKIVANGGIGLASGKGLTSGDRNIITYTTPADSNTVDISIGDSNINGVSIATAALIDLTHIKGNTSYKIWDESNFDPNDKADSTDLNNYLPLSAGRTKKLTGGLYFDGVKNLLLTQKNRYAISTNTDHESESDDYVFLGNYVNRTYLMSTYNTDIYHYIGEQGSVSSGSRYRMWDAYNLPNPAKISDLAAYLLLSGGIMTGGVTFNNNIGLSWKNTAGSVLQQAYFNNNNVFVIGNTSNSQLVLRTGNTDVLRDRNGDSYKIWDSYNLPNPAGSTDLDGYLPLTAGPTKPLAGKLYMNAGARLLNNKALYGVTSEGAEYPLIHMSSNDTIKVGSIHSPIEITSEVSDVLHNRAGTAYKIWDAYNLSSPATTTDLNSYIPRSAQGVTTSLLNLQGGIYRGGASMDGEFGYSCNMLLRFDSGGTNWYTGGILSISTGGELRVAGVLNGALSVWRNMAVQGMANNFLYNGNEVTFISQTEALSGVWLNYRGCAGGITDYLLGSGKGDGTYGNLVAAYIQAHNGFILPNGKTLASKNSAGVSRNLAYISAGSDIAIFGDNLLPLRFRSTNGGIAHSRWINNEEKIYTIWDSYDVPSPVSGSGGVAGQLAKWSAATALSGGIAYSSGNMASTVVARNGNGAFSATTVTATNANITNLNPGGENCVVQSGLIPRATSTCFLGSASRIFQNIYGNNIYTGVALLPVTTATAAIGTADLTYQSGYIQTIHTGGVLPLTTASSVGSSAKPFSSMYATTFNGSATKWGELSLQVVSSMPSTTVANTLYIVLA